MTIFCPKIISQYKCLKVNICYNSVDQKNKKWHFLRVQVSYMFDIGFLCKHKRSWKVFTEICKNNVLKVFKRNPKDLKKNLKSTFFWTNISPVRALDSWSLLEIYFNCLLCLIYTNLKFLFYTARHLQQQAKFKMKSETSKTEQNKFW